MDDQMNVKAKAFLNSLSDEQKEKVCQCKNPEELMNALGGDTELPDEMLEMVSGGAGFFDTLKRIIIMITGDTASEGSGQKKSE
ncbi:MAG: hypothetical protein K6G81_12115 [Lachnospiraceae bacterium]|nr:hypothetical protein [Lachnospiraceae bacterium]